MQNLLFANSLLHALSNVQQTHIISVVVARTLHILQYLIANFDHQSET
jgi:hypothetical protein